MSHGAFVRILKQIHAIEVAIGLLEQAGVRLDRTPGSCKGKVGPERGAFEGRQPRLPSGSVTPLLRRSRVENLEHAALLHESLMAASA